MASFTGTVFSDVLGMNTNIILLTPKRFKGKMSELKVVYLLHGLTENTSDWHDKSYITMLADIYNLAFVLPEVQRSFYTDMAYGLPYFSYITEELPQICERYFGLSREREKNFIFGLSMGGYGALKAALKKPQQYSACCAFSAVCDIREWIATHGKSYINEYKAIWGMDFELLEQNDLYTIAKQTADYSIKPKLYLASGTSDFIHSMSVSFREYLYNLDYDFTYEQWEGGHEWCFWNEAIVQACKVVFGEPPKNMPLPTVKI